MLNTTVYPDIYKVDFTQGSGANIQRFSIPFSHSIRDALNLNLYTTADPLENSNVYTVYNNAAESTIGEYTLLQWPDSNTFRHFKTEIKKTDGKKNLRMFFATQQNQNPSIYRSSFSWGDLGSYQDTYKTSPITATSALVSCSYSGFDIFTRDYRNFSLISSSAGPGSIFTLNPITKIDINALILLPYFHICTRRIYNYNSETGMYANISSITVTSRSWTDIKPADATPQGPYYDDELYNYGYKVTYGDGDITLQWVDHVRIIPYYGITDTLYDENTDSFTNNTKGMRINFCNMQNAADDAPQLNIDSFTKNLRYQIFTILSEELNADTGQIIYSSLPGIIFSDLNSNSNSEFGLQESISTNSSGTQITQASGFTPLTQYYGNSTYSGIYGKTEISGNPTVIVPAIAVHNEYTAITSGFTYDETGHFINVGSNTRYVVATNGHFSLKKLWATIAAMGLFVADSQVCAQNVNLADFNCNRLYIGEMLPNGETTGNMLQGQDIANSLQPSLDDIINDTPVVPVNPLVPPIDDDGEDDTRKRNDGTNLPMFDGIRAVSGTGFSTFYLLSSYHVAELGQLLSSMPQGFWESLGTATDYKMSNVLDYISAIKWYPLDIHATAPSNFPDVQTSDLQFGFNGVSKVTFTAAGTSFKLGTVNRVYDMGYVSIPYRSGNGQTFLDLEPYTDVYINLPYVGKTQLQANQVLGYTISVHYVIDLITGMCTCFVDNGYDTLYTGGGKIGVDITVAGNDVITQAERMTSAYVGTVTHGISNALSLGGALSSEDVAGAASGYSTMISGIVSDCIATANAKRGVPQVVGGGSGFGSTYAAQSPCIIVQRPAVKIPASYGHSVGYIYNAYARIGDLSGYTICDNPDLSGIPATSAELEMIKNILLTGFYA